MKIVIVAAALVIAAPALAQQAAPNPCARGATTVKMAGIDLDQLRCTIAFSQNQLGVLEIEVLQLQAQVTLLEADLAAAKPDAAKPADAPKPASAPATPKSEGSK